MQPSALHQIGTLVLCTCSVILETSGASVEKPLARTLGFTSTRPYHKHTSLQKDFRERRLLQKRVMATVRYRPYSAKYATPHEGWHTDSNDMYFDASKIVLPRTRRSARVASGETEGNFRKTTFMPTTAPVQSSSTTSDGIVTRGTEGSESIKAALFKGPNRTRKMTLPYVPTATRRMKNDNDERGNRSPPSPGRQHSQLRQHSPKAGTLKTRESTDTVGKERNLEMTKLQNRPRSFVKEAETKETFDQKQALEHTMNSSSSSATTTTINLITSPQQTSYTTSRPQAIDVTYPSRTTTPSNGSITLEAETFPTERTYESSNPFLRFFSRSTSKRDKRRRIRHQGRKLKSSYRQRYNKSRPRNKEQYVDNKDGSEMPNSKIRNRSSSADITKESTFNGGQFITSPEVTSSPIQQPGDDEGRRGDCPNCGTRGISEDEVKALKLGMFQELVAQKLRLDKNDVRFDASFQDSMPILPDTVLEQTFKDNAEEDEREEEFYARDQQIFIPGDDMGRDCIDLPVTGCYTFDLDGKVKNDIASAHIWFYKTPDGRDAREHMHTFVLYELDRDRDDVLQHRNLISRLDIFKRNGWIRMNVTREARRWLEKRRSTEMLAIRCKTCVTRNHKALFGAKEGYKPLLSIKYANDRPSIREKRSESCDPRTECCKRPLVANFNQINLPNIIQPKNLTMDYCYGYCDGVNQFTFNHTTIKQQLRWVHYTEDDQMRAQLKPCCVPLELRDALILTLENGDVVRKVLPKVKVERCGCL